MTTAADPLTDSPRCAAPWCRTRSSRTAAADAAARRPPRQPVGRLLSTPRCSPTSTSSGAGSRPPRRSAAIITGREPGIFAPLPARRDRRAPGARAPGAARPRLPGVHRRLRPLAATACDALLASPPRASPSSPARTPPSTASARCPRSWSPRSTATRRFGCEIALACDLRVMAAARADRPRRSLPPSRRAFTAPSLARSVRPRALVMLRARRTTPTPPTTRASSTR